MSLERRVLLLGYGAEMVLTPASEGMAGAVRRAEQIKSETPDSWIPAQFDNPANPEIHRKTTAVEIWEDTEGAVDIVVGGIGTGGTITGVGQVLKPLKPSVQIDRGRADRVADSDRRHVRTAQDPGSRRELRSIRTRHCGL